MRCSTSTARRSSRDAASTRCTRSSSPVDLSRTRSRLAGSTRGFDTCRLGPQRLQLNAPRGCGARCALLELGRCRMRTVATAIVLGIVVIAWPARAHAQSEVAERAHNTLGPCRQLGVNVWGLSYHVNRNTEYDERNW